VRINFFVFEYPRHGLLFKLLTSTNIDEKARLIKSIILGSFLFDKFSIPPFNFSKFFKTSLENCFSDFKKFGATAGLSNFKLLNTFNNFFGETSQEFSFVSAINFNNGLSSVPTDRNPLSFDCTCTVPHPVNGSKIVGFLYSETY